MLRLYPLAGVRNPPRHIDPLDKIMRVPRQGPGKSTRARQQRTRQTDQSFRGALAGLRHRPPRDGLIAPLFGHIIFPEDVPPQSFPLSLFLDLLTRTHLNVLGGTPVGGLLFTDPPLNLGTPKRAGDVSYPL